MEIRDRKIDPIERLQLAVIEAFVNESLVSHLSCVLVMYLKIQIASLDY